MHVRQGAPRAGAGQYELFRAGSLAGAKPTPGPEHSTPASGGAAATSWRVKVVKGGDSSVIDAENWLSRFLTKIFA